MRTIANLCLALGLLSACNSSSPDLRKARAGNAELKMEALKSAELITIDGLTFNVAKVAGSYSHIVLKPGHENLPPSEREGGFAFIAKPYALVQLQSPSGTSYTSSQVVKAAETVTKCDGTFAAGVLAFVGGFGASTDLQDVEKKITSNFDGWRVDIDC